MTGPAARAPSVRRTATSSRTLRAHALGLATALYATQPALSLAQPQTEPSSEPSATAPPTPTPPPGTAPEPAAPAAPVTPPPPPESEPEKEQGGERRLKRHVFQFPAYVTTSFIASYVGVRVRLGASTVENLPTEVGPISIDAVTVAEVLDLGIKVSDWLGLYATAGGRSLVGSNLRSLTYDGATYDVGGVGGVILRIFESERTGSRLAFVGGGGATRGQVTTLYPLVERPLASVVDLLQRDLGDSIRTPFTLLTFSGRFAFAQSLGPLFGVQLTANLGGTWFTVEPYDRLRATRDSSTSRELTYGLGIAPSVDFNALRVPIAVMPEYVVSRSASSAAIRGSGDFDTFHQVAVGAYYSGRRNLQLGLIWASILGARPLETPQGRSSAPQQQSMELNLRYVW